MNDSLRTNLFVRYDPEKIACACIFLASRQLNVSLIAVHSSHPFIPSIHPTHSFCLVVKILVNCA